MVCIALAVHTSAFAQASKSTMSKEAKDAQNMLNPLFPKIILPFSYNFNQKLGADSSMQQNQFQFNPVIPVALEANYQVLLNPLLTVNRNIDNQLVTNQNQPVQLATYFGPRFAGDWFAGIGPYFQIPANNANNGSRQYGAGVSAGISYTPDNWNFTSTFYNSWGFGGDLSGGTANVLNVQPSISYTTDHAVTYSLGSQIAYNYGGSAATNQLTLSGGKTIHILGFPLMFQIGPTYMITANQTSAKGIGGYMSFTAMVDK
jgi:hypothetical protein